MKEKFRLSYGHNDGRSADLELCVFCQRIGDLNDIGKCEHFAEGYCDFSVIAAQLDEIAQLVSSEATNSTENAKEGADTCG